MVYSPLGVTFGYRSDLLLESSADYRKYHLKLNNKLKQLRGRLNLISKDTRNYKGYEKLLKIDNESYNKNRLHGFLVLLMAERDLVFAECIKMDARDRGHFKPKEIKVLRSRIKRALEHCSRVLELMKDEDKTSIVAELHIYEKLARVEYELFGRNQMKYSNAAVVSQHLSIAFAAADVLMRRDMLQEDVYAAIKNRYNYIFKEKANAFSLNEQRKYIYMTVQENYEDALIQLLGPDEFKIEEVDQNGSNEQSKLIEWRSYSALIEDIRVFEVLNELQDFNANDETLIILEDKIVKWNKAIDLQKDFMESLNDEYENSENNQILLTYLQYNSLLTSAKRDIFLFNQLSEQWRKLVQKSMATKVLKYKEIEHVVKGLTARLDQVLDLPGVYSDMDLTNEVSLLKTVYETSFVSQFLAPLYQSKKKFMEALALYLDCKKKLENATSNISSWDSISIPQLLEKEKIDTLKESILRSLKDVVALAQYEKSLKLSKQEKRWQKSLVESLEDDIHPAVASLDNIFPLRPRIMPVRSKPSMFDIAYNYFSSYSHPTVSDDNNSSGRTNMDTESIGSPTKPTKDSKKKGIFGFFSS